MKPHEINAKTRLYGLIGHPVAHSFSPVFQNDLVRTFGFDAAYLAFDVPPERLGDLRRTMMTLGISGLNVTVPHKEAIIAQLDEIDGSAAGIGAVNTIHRVEDRLIGYNTDVLGFMRLLETFGLEPEKTPVAVLGAGGASRAVLQALKQAGYSNLRLFNRTVSKAERLLEIFGFHDAEARGLDQFDLVPGQLTINTTSVGLHGDETPVRLIGGEATNVAIDLIYNPLRTRFLAEAERQGMRTANGLAMLLHQGIRSFEIWHGVAVSNTQTRELFERMYQRLGGGA